MTKTVMVVDDEADNRNTVKAVLKKNGYKVITAVNADDCLLKLKKEKVDLVLLDIMMPGTPVREIITRMAGSKVAYLTVVRVSEAERENLLKQKGVVGFIQKPYDIDDLIRNVKKYIGK